MTSKLLMLFTLATATVFAVAAEPPATENPPIVELTESGVGRESTGLVTIAARGTDVREVLFDLFDQEGKNFVLQPNIRFVLYLSLAGVEFDEALAIVCQLAELQYDVQNGIYFIGRRTGNAPVAPVQVIRDPEPAPAPPRPTGRISEQELQARLTTRLARTDLREVIEEFTRQTGIKIEVADDVPRYAIDAFLINTSLKYSLDVITRAANLRYVLTDFRTVRIERNN